MDEENNESELMIFAASDALLRDAVKKNKDFKPILEHVSGTFKATMAETGNLNAQMAKLEEESVSHTEMISALEFHIKVDGTIRRHLVPPLEEKPISI